MKRVNGRVIKLLVLITCALILSCSAPGPEPIRYGEDACNYCRMTIVDQQFGTELLTRTGKVYKFDSIECLAAFVRQGDVPSDQVRSTWVTDFSQPTSFINTTDAVYVQSDEMRSPMGMGLFGFSSQADAESFVQEHDGTIVSWDGLADMVEEAWFGRP